MKSAFVTCLLLPVARLPGDRAAAYQQVVTSRNHAGLRVFSGPDHVLRAEKRGEAPRLAREGVGTPPPPIDDAARRPAGQTGLPERSDRGDRGPAARDDVLDKA